MRCSMRRSERERDGRKEKGGGEERERKSCCAMITVGSLEHMLKITGMKHPQTSGRSYNDSPCSNPRVPCQSLHTHPSASLQSTCGFRSGMVT